MRHMFISTHSFPFDRVFGEAATNQDVYAQSARLLLPAIHHSTHYSFITHSLLLF
jgi:hypothetical protein